jgi:phage-related protein
MHMKYLKIALVAAAVQLFVPTVSAQEANAEVATMFATAQSQGQSLTDFVAQITNLKTCNPKLAEKVVEFALEQAKDDPVVVEEILRSVANSCVDQDTTTAYAIAAGIDPTLVSNALGTATAAGPAAGGGATVPVATATPPGTTGAGGGSGSGEDTASTN